MSIEELKKENEELRNEIANLKLFIQQLKKVVFGPKKEETPSNLEQLSLFDDETDLNNSIDDETKKITVTYTRNQKNKKAGIRADKLKDAIIETVEYDLDAETKCEECDNTLVYVGKKLVRQEIEIIPMQIKITNFVQKTYKCSKCEVNGNSNFIVSAKLPKPILTHTFLSSSLMSEIIYNKFMLGTPLYRQESLWRELGLILPRNNMANWIIRVSEYYLTHISELIFKKMLLSNLLVHADETGIQCNKEDGRNASTKSFIWAIVSGEQELEKGAYFHYSQTREGKEAEKLLLDYHGIVETDGYAGYNGLVNCTHSECWAHARRYFYESIPLVNNNLDINATGYIGLIYCNKLFKIEQDLKELSNEERKKKRQEISKVVVDEFFDWVETILSTTTIANSKLKKALVYALNQKKELSAFLDDGRIPLSNNRAERAIRPFAIHRKNWLFADSVAGAKATAVMYTIVESAKLNNLNIKAYIKYLLENLSQEPDLNNENQLEKFLPWSKDLPEHLIDDKSEKGNAVLSKDDIIKISKESLTDNK